MGIFQSHLYLKITFKQKRYLSTINELILFIVNTKVLFKSKKMNVIIYVH